MTYFRVLLTALKNQTDENPELEKFELTMPLALTAAARERARRVLARERSDSSESSGLSSWISSLMGPPPVGGADAEVDDGGGVPPLSAAPTSIVVALTIGKWEFVCAEDVASDSSQPAPWQLRVSPIPSLRFSLTSTVIEFEGTPQRNSLSLSAAAATLSDLSCPYPPLADFISAAKSTDSKQALRGGDASDPSLAPPPLRVCFESFPDRAPILRATLRAPRCVYTRDRFDAFLALFSLPPPLHVTRDGASAALWRDRLRYREAIRFDIVVSNVDLVVPFDSMSESAPGSLAKLPFLTLKSADGGVGDSRAFYDTLLANVVVESATPYCKFEESGAFANVLMTPLTLKYEMAFSQLPRGQQTGAIFAAEIDRLSMAASATQLNNLLATYEGALKSKRHQEAAATFRAPGAETADFVSTFVVLEFSAAFKSEGGGVAQLDGAAVELVARSDASATATDYSLKSLSVTFAPAAAKDSPPLDIVRATAADATARAHVLLPRAEGASRVVRVALSSLRFDAYSVFVAAMTSFLSAATDGRFASEGGGGLNVAPLDASVYFDAQEGGVRTPFDASFKLDALTVHLYPLHQTSCVCEASLIDSDVLWRSDGASDDFRLTFASLNLRDARPEEEGGGLARLTTAPTETSLRVTFLRGGGGSSGREVDDLTVDLKSYIIHWDGPFVQSLQDIVASLKASVSDDVLSTSTAAISSAWEREMQRERAFRAKFRFDKPIFVFRSPLRETVRADLGSIFVSYDGDLAISVRSSNLTDGCGGLIIETIDFDASQKGGGGIVDVDVHDVKARLYAQDVALLSRVFNWNVESIQSGDDDGEQLPAIARGGVKSLSRTVLLRRAVIYFWNDGEVLCEFKLRDVSVQSIISDNDVLSTSTKLTEITVNFVEVASASLGLIVSSDSQSAKSLLNISLSQGHGSSDALAASLTSLRVVLIPPFLSAALSALTAIASAASGFATPPLRSKSSPPSRPMSAHIIFEHTRFIFVAAVAKREIDVAFRMLIRAFISNGALDVAQVALKHASVNFDSHDHSLSRPFVKDVSAALEVSAATSQLFALASSGSPKSTPTSARSKSIRASTRFRRVMCVLSEFRAYISFDDVALVHEIVSGFRAHLFKDSSVRSGSNEDGGGGNVVADAALLTTIFLMECRDFSLLVINDVYGSALIPFVELSLDALCIDAAIDPTLLYLTASAFPAISIFSIGRVSWEPLVERTRVTFAARSRAGDDVAVTFSVRDAMVVNLTDHCVATISVNLAALTNASKAQGAASNPARSAIFFPLQVQNLTGRDLFARAGDGEAIQIQNGARVAVVSNNKAASRKGRFSLPRELFVGLSLAALQKREDGGGAGFVVDLERNEPFSVSLGQSRSVVVCSRVMNDAKVIDVLSPVQLRNATNSVARVSVSREGCPPHELEVPGGGAVIHAPILDPSHGEMTIEVSEGGAMGPNLKLKDFTLQRLSNPSHTAFCFAHVAPSRLFAREVTLAPPVSFFNATPVEVEFEFVAPNARWVGRAASKTSSSSLRFDRGAPILVAMRLPDGSAARMSVQPFLPTVCSLRFGAMELAFSSIAQRDGSLEVALCAPLVLVSRVGIELLVRTSGHVLKVVGSSIDPPIGNAQKPLSWRALVLLPTVSDISLSADGGATFSQAVPLLSRGTADVDVARSESKCATLAVRAKRHAFAAYKWIEAEIIPRFVLLNLTELELIFAPSRTREPVSVPPAAAVPFFPSRGGDEFKFKFKDKGRVWLWSGDITFDFSGESHILLPRDVPSSGADVISIDVSHREGARVLSIGRSKRPPFLFVNTLATPVALSQSKRAPVFVPSGTSQPFAWTHPLEARRIFVSLQDTHDVLSTDVEAAHLDVTWSHVESLEPPHVELSSTFDGPTRVVTLRLVGDDSATRIDTSFDTPTLRIIARVERLHVALVDATPADVAAITLTGAEFEFSDSPSRKSLCTTVCDAQVDDLRVDATVEVPLRAAMEAPSLSRRDALRAYVEIATSCEGANFVDVRRLSATLRPLELFITPPFVIALMRWARAATKRFPVAAADSSAAPPLRLADVDIAHVDVILSFSNAHQVEEPLTPREQAFIETMMAVPAVEGAALRLFPDIRITSVMMSRDGVVSAATAAVRAAIGRQTLALVASLTMLGNPKALAKNVKEGVRKLAENTKEGQSRGTIGMLGGAVKGTGMLLSSSVSGVAQSASLISNSLSHQLDKLGEPEAPSRSRDRSESVFDGVINGFRSLSTGVVSGVAGLIVEPAKGAQSGGVEGFFGGLGRGVIGAVTRPVSGALQFVSSTSEGLSKSFQVSKIDSPMRYRRPRVFAKDRPLPFALEAADNPPLPVCFFTPTGALKMGPSSVVFEGPEVAWAMEWGSIVDVEVDGAAALFHRADVAVPFRAVFATSAADAADIRSEAVRFLSAYRRRPGPAKVQRRDSEEATHRKN